jgi:hypothetical protein
MWTRTGCDEDTDDTVRNVRMESDERIPVGFVTDEFNLLVNIGQRYTLAMYDNPVNLAMDTFLLIALMKLSQPQRVLYYLPEREI